MVDNKLDTLDKEEQYKIAKELFDKKQYKECFPILVDLANEWHSGAQCLLGIMYEHGYYVTKDLGKAAYYFKRSADQGNEFAKDELDRIIYSETHPGSNIDL